MLSFEQAKVTSVHIFFVLSAELGVNDQSQNDILLSGTHSKSKITFKTGIFCNALQNVKKKAQSKSKFYIKTNLFI